jgi:hypothetical protein
VRAPETPQLDLESYRAQADRFDSELLEEYYLHYAGHKEELELEPIYERHRTLTQLDQVQAIGAMVNGDERVRWLWRFACEGYIGDLTKENAERIARLEAELEATVDGETIPYRMLRPAMANADDRGQRQRLFEAGAELTDEHLNPIYLESAQTLLQAIPGLGSPDYVELYVRLGFDLDGLARECRDLLDSTERLWEDSADRLFRSRLGLGLREARTWDVARLFRAPTWDAQFPADRMLPSLEATLDDLGIDLHAQSNVHLDLEVRPNKSPRAFCAPIEIPDKVMLVIQPIGGLDDWRALFHEAGHTEHYAHTSSDLAFEHKRLGDVAVTEGWASLLEQLVSDPAWLSRRLDFPRPNEFAAEGGVSQLYFARRYAAKLLYELEFYRAADPRGLRQRYVDILGDALKIEPSPTNFLADIDSGFYVTEYLRSWAFESQLREHLREQFGHAWFARREAGSLLRELWAEGQARRADEMLADVTGAPLEMEALAARIREAVKAA